MYTIYIYIYIHIHIHIHARLRDFGPIDAPSLAGRLEHTSRHHQTGVCVCVCARERERERE